MTNYKRGRAAEYAAMKELENKGYTTMRAAGSHGPADIVAFNEREILLVQVKSAQKFVPLQTVKDALIDMEMLPRPTNARCQVWVKQGREKFKIHKLAAMVGRQVMIEAI